MSQPLDPIAFPLSGSRLIEASAGTGKTWTIAALYVRLVLGHGGEAAYARPLLPAEILVMTFTRAATRELSDRIRQRLMESARVFRGESAGKDDPFLRQLLTEYPEGLPRQRAAFRLALAADAMDDAGIFTIDAWCQRMLREHAFDSGCLFDETLVSSEDAVLRDAVRDYWRHHVYALDAGHLARVRECWSDFTVLEGSIGKLVGRADHFRDAGGRTLAEQIVHIESEHRQCAARLKAGWTARIADIEKWMADNRKAMDGTRLPAKSLTACYEAVRKWAGDADAVHPDKGFENAWQRLSPDFLQSIRKNKDIQLDIPPCFGEVGILRKALAEFEPMKHIILQHAARTIARRVAELKRRRRQFGFSDMLVRLREALEGSGGEALRERILTQFPVALIDEFQDTSPDQYRIFDRLYRVADNDAGAGLFLIGDPKQAIYGFRGADIHSYLAAREATAGRHYRLGMNYRSTGAVVNAVNHLFLHAEGGNGAGGHAAGAFRFREGGSNPLPFDKVEAKGRAETFAVDGKPVCGLTLWCNTQEGLSADAYRAHFAGLCAETIVTLLNQPRAGFTRDGEFTRLEPADIAILVRNRDEALAARRALQQRGVASVYLSDKDSVYRSHEAADVLRWLKAVANPFDGGLARAAYATRTAGLDLAMLLKLAHDDAAWEARVEQLKALRQVWQRQGVLAMLRRFIHELELPRALSGTAGGERRLTDLLHLAELLQTASQHLDGEQALIRWLARQIEQDADGGDERILRLESDAKLVKVVTVHKSKGMEYPLVFLPFAVTTRLITRKNRRFLEYADRHGKRRIDFGMSEEGLKAMNAARLEEDLRLLYVALTRARHAMWAGVVSINDAFHDTALGYLMSGGQPVPCAQLRDKLAAMCGGCADIHIENADSRAGFTLLARDDSGAALADDLVYDGKFERHWGVASYTSMIRDLGAMPAPATPLEAKLLEEEAGDAPAAAQDEPWHRFPRGSIPGQFLHAQLEWLANEGFAAAQEPGFQERIEARCEQAGWGNRKEDAAAWLHRAAVTPLPPLGRPLGALGKTWPEMEFWLPAKDLRVERLDRLCQAHLLDGLPRPKLQARQLQGMLRGFKDLVFELDGRYWVLDYKSNALGNDDAAYHKEALAAGMAAHRYDVQGMIYLLALHRLLALRLQAQYDPAEHLGGALFFFLRGVGNADTRGCYHLLPDPALLSSAEEILCANLSEGVAA